MIKTIPQAIDDMAVSLGASPSAEIPTVAQALENVYTALGGDRTDLDTLVVSEVIDLVAPLIQGGGGGGGGGDFTTAKLKVTNADSVGELSMVGVNMITILGDMLDGEQNNVIYGEPLEADVVLYKGSQTIYINAESIVSTSGAIEGNMDDGFIITGDAEIVAIGQSM